MISRSKCGFPCCEKFECANNEKNHCMALMTADFGGKPCPFYKTRGQARKDRYDALKRLGAKTQKEKAELTKLREDVSEYGKT